MKNCFTLPHLLLVIISMLSITHANASLIASTDGKTIYDNDLNITWLANANLAATNTFSLARNTDLGTISGVSTLGSYIFNDGRMTWGGAMQWIAAMNTANYLGYSDWRLPTTPQQDLSCSNNVGFTCTGSEMGHLFYNELGGSGYSSIAATHNASYGLFNNVQSDDYWSGTEWAPNTYVAWGFNFNQGNPDLAYKDNRLYALAVRDGLVDAAPDTTVPEPSTTLLFVSGFLGLVGFARRRNRS